MRRHGVLFYLKLLAYGFSIGAAWDHDVIVMIAAGILATFLAFVD